MNDSLRTSDISGFEKLYVHMILRALSGKRQLRKFLRKLGLYLVPKPDLTQFPMPIL
jgi:hypothetical protein